MFDYTVVIRFHNGYDTIDRVIQSWKNQTVPPTEILIFDNGSYKELDYNSDPQIRVVRIPYVIPIAHETNMAVDAVNTNRFILANDDTLVNCEYAETQIKLSGPDTQIFGIGRFNIDASTQVCPEGKIGQWPISHKDTGKYIYTKPLLCVEIIDNVIPPTPHDMAMYTKDNWLRCNEILTGYGYQDSEYFARWMIMGRKTFMTNKCVLFHLDHPVPYINSPINQHNGEIYEKLRDHYLRTKIIPTLTRENSTYSPPDEEDIEIIWGSTE